jgi:hypothetical protein
MVGRITVAVYLIAAIGFGAFLQLRQPFATVGAATIGGAIGTAGALTVVPGIIPAIIWAIGQFRPKETRPDYRGIRFTRLDRSRHGHGNVHGGWRQI